LTRLLASRQLLPCQVACQRDIAMLPLLCRQCNCTRKLLILCRRSGTHQRSLSDDDSEDFQPVKRACREDLPFAASDGRFTGRLAGQASRAQCDMVSSQSGLEDEVTDTEMQDSGTEQGAGVQHSRPQLTPRTLFPGLSKARPSLSKARPSLSKARPSLSKHHAAAGSKGVGFSSRLVGSSSHVPSLATYMGLGHAVADEGELCDLLNVVDWQTSNGNCCIAKLMATVPAQQQCGLRIGANSDKTHCLEDM
jgi:hypothetical protein